MIVLQQFSITLLSCFAFNEFIKLTHNFRNSSFILKYFKALFYLYTLQILLETKNKFCLTEILFNHVKT